MFPFCNFRRVLIYCSRYTILMLTTMVLCVYIMYGFKCINHLLTIGNNYFFFIYKLIFIIIIFSPPPQRTSIYEGIVCYVTVISIDKMYYRCFP